MRIFINEKPFDLAPGATVSDAIRAYDPALASRVDGLLLTDARGLPLTPADSLVAGSILRVGRSARTAVDADA